MDERTFTALTALTPTAAAGRFDVTLDPQWTIAGKPNGGYLAALLARAATEVGPHPHTLALSVHYLRSPDPGPARVNAEMLRAGRNASQLRAWLAQGGHPCVEAIITTGRLDPAAEPRWSGGVPDPGQADRASAHRLPGVNPAGVPVPIMDEVDVRIDEDTLGFASGRPSGRGELRGWLSLPGDEPFDPTSLVYAVDSFPPATFEVELSRGWVPTIELTVYVRALPAPGPVRVLHQAHLVDGDRVDEQTWIWDSRGRLVAQGTQLAGIRFD